MGFIWCNSTHDNFGDIKNVREDLKLKIGLFDIDSKYHNLALMKLSAWHKQKGDETELYNPLWHSTYDTIYCSKIFRKSHKNDGYVRENMICGGSGFEYLTLLPEYIEHIKPDYGLYDLKYSLGFTTRGCIRNCKFCIVPEKEGKIREHAEVEEFLNSESNIVVLLDNNFLALPSHIKKLQLFINKNWRIDFNQGLDLRLINKENAELLTKLKIYKRLRFSWDFLKIEEEVKKGLNMLFKAGFKPSRIMVYMLCDYDTTFEEDFYRFEELIKLKVDPFVMIYDGFSQARELRDFSHWVNKRLYKICNWEVFKKIRKI